MKEFTKICLLLLHDTAAFLYRVGINVWQYYESMSMDELYVNVKNTSRGDSTVLKDREL
jgi:hypothetical protein